MQIPSRAWGFIRSGLNGRFGVRVVDFGTGGTEDNPLLNDVDAGDEAAGVEFCPVFAAQEASGTLTVRSNGALSFVGAADGTYVIPYALYTFTPGDAASVDEGDTDVTVTVGGSSVSLIIADSLHGHTADNLIFTSSTTLLIAHANHVHSVDNLTLTTDVLLIIADAIHNHYADELNLSNIPSLSINDALHLHYVDSFQLSTETLLAIQSTTHGHQASNVALILAGLGVSELVTGTTILSRDFVVTMANAQIVAKLFNRLN